MVINKGLIKLLILTLLVSLMAYPLNYVKAVEFEFEAESVLLADPLSGEILYEKNSHEIQYPASITKIMTIILVMEALEGEKVSLEDKVFVSENAANLGGSQIFLSAGDEIDLENMMIGLTVGSGNDAAVAVAEHIAGSVEGFVEKMNSKAKDLGMENTHFVNPHGLHHEEHYTTAQDVYIMSRELLKYPKVHEWFSIWMDEDFLAGKLKGSEGVFLSNPNRMIKNYKGADGLKTGFTDQAGNCVSATAKRENTRFIAIVMDAPGRDVCFTEAKKLLDYGFAMFESLSVVEEGEKISTIFVEKGVNPITNIVVDKGYSITIEKGEDPVIDKKVHYDNKIRAPLEKGDKVGTLDIYKDEKKIKQLDLVISDCVEKANFLTLLNRTIQSWLRF